MIIEGAPPGGGTEAASASSGDRAGLARRARRLVRWLRRLGARLRLAPAMLAYRIAGFDGFLLGRAADPGLGAPAVHVLADWALDRLPEDYPTPVDVLEALQAAGHDLGPGPVRRLTDRAEAVEADRRRREPLTPVGMIARLDEPETDPEIEAWKRLLRDHPEVMVRIFAIHLADREQIPQGRDHAAFALSSRCLRAVARHPEAIEDDRVRRYFTRSVNFGYYKEMALEAADPTGFASLLERLLEQVREGRAERRVAHVIELLEEADTGQIGALGDDVWRALLAWPDGRVREAAVRRLDSRNGSPAA